MRDQLLQEKFCALQGKFLQFYQRRLKELLYRNLTREDMPFFYYFNATAIEILRLLPDSQLDLLYHLLVAFQSIRILCNLDNWAALNNFQQFMIYIMQITDMTIFNVADLLEQIVSAEMPQSLPESCPGMQAARRIQVDIFRQIAEMLQKIWSREIKVDCVEEVPLQELIASFYEN